MQLNPPASPVLLHVCCAPCSGAIIEALCTEGLRPTLFWSNSNIYTADENERRLAVLQPYAAKFGLQVVVDEYDHAAWREFVASQMGAGPDGAEQLLASCPERGARCELCFRFRLLRAARYAAAGGFGCLTTSLASSRWKSLEQVDEAGEWAVAQVNSEAAGASAGASAPAAGLLWWPQNWRKGGLQERRGAIIREQNFYNQSFRGCEYSANHESTNNSIS